VTETRLTLCDIAQAYHATSGGIRTYLHEKRRYLSDHTPHHHVLIVPADRDWVEVDGPRRTYGVAGPRIPGCAPYRLVLRTGAVRRILAHERPDVIELGGVDLTVPAAFAHRRRHGGRVVGFYHTDFPRAYVDTVLGRRSPRVRRRVRRWATRLARSVYGRCDLTITASPAFAAKLRRLGLGPVAYVPLGVDPELFSPLRRDPGFRARLGMADDELALVYAGRLDAEKRIATLIDAFRRIPPQLRSRLVLVGDGPLAGLADEAARHDPRIVRLPYQSDRQALSRVLASSDLYVSAAPHETFGLAVVEAQASGLAVAGVRAGAMVERVPETVGLLAPELSAESLAGTIVELATNGFRARGRAARALVAANFSWDATFARWLGAVQDIVPRTS
jgi:alpha-1,6-mannosyltransferase